MRRQYLSGTDSSSDRKRNRPFNYPAGRDHHGNNGSAGNDGYNNNPVMFCRPDGLRREMRGSENGQ
jgi:hypothetical protein